MALSEPSTTNQLAESINAILKDIIENKGEDAALTAIVTDFPVVANPVLYQLTKWAIELVAPYFYDFSAEIATKIIIDIQTLDEQSLIRKSLSNLNDAINTGDQNAINKAEDDADTAWGNLIHYDGSATP